MSIPLYFAAECKAFTTASPQLLKAFTGFGIYNDGSPRIPSMAGLAKGLVVIDDQTLPQVEVPENTFETLITYCKAGCFFDFMQAPTQAHSAIIQGFLPLLGKESLVLVAETYGQQFLNCIPVISCPFPLNHWERFIRQCGKLYPSGWCLELIPWAWKMNTSLNTQKSEEYLENVMCLTKHTGGIIQYYDTAETLLSRLHLAENYGCRYAIGLYHELTELGINYIEK